MQRPLLLSCNAHPVQSPPVLASAQGRGFVKRINKTWELSQGESAQTTSDGWAVMGEKHGVWMKLPVMHRHAYRSSMNGNAPVQQ
jgi:hypothetical protein